MREIVRYELRLGSLWSRKFAWCKYKYVPKSRQKGNRIYPGKTLNGRKLHGNSIITDTNSRVGAEITGYCISENTVTHTNWRMGRSLEHDTKASSKYRIKGSILQNCVPHILSCIIIPRLHLVFPEASLNVNGAPGNIQSNWLGTRHLHLNYGH